MSAAEKVVTYDYGDNSNPSAPDVDGDVKTLLDVAKGGGGEEEGRKNLERMEGVKAIEWAPKDRQLLITTRATATVPVTTVTTQNLIAAALPSKATLAATMGVYAPAFTVDFKCVGCKTDYRARTVSAIKNGGEFFQFFQFFRSLLFFSRVWF